jgi:hypothetical protein
MTSEKMACNHSGSHGQNVSQDVGHYIYFGNEDVYLRSCRQL